MYLAVTGCAGIVSILSVVVISWSAVLRALISLGLGSVMVGVGPAVSLGCCTVFVSSVIGVVAVSLVCCVFVSSVIGVGVVALGVGVAVLRCGKGSPDQLGCGPVAWGVGVMVMASALCSLNCCLLCCWLCCLCL